MNQGIAFARTLRALDADGFGGSKFGLLLAAILLVAWTWWAFAARVPQYEATTNMRIESVNAVAYFPADVMRRISVGQPALIHVDGIAFSSRVQSITPDHINVALPANSQLLTAASSSASIEIETTRVSPMALALRIFTRGNR